MPTDQTLAPTSDAPAASAPEASAPSGTPALDTDGKAVTSEAASTPSTTSADKSAVPAPPKGAASRSRFQERISDLVAKSKRLEEENRALRAELDGIRQSAKPTAPAASPDAGSLRPEQFENYGDYVQALVEQTITRTIEAQRSERARQALELHRQERLQAFQQDAEPLRQQYGDDFDAAIADPTLPITEAMADAVLELEDGLGPLVMLYLANNRAEAQRIAQLNPRAATVAIGRLATRMEQARQSPDATANPPGPEPLAAGTRPGAATPPPSRPAPKAVPPVRGASPLVATGPTDSMSVEDWIKAERERLRAKYGRPY